MCDPTDEVREALGLTLADLFDEPITRFDYPDGRWMERTQLGDNPKRIKQSKGPRRDTALYRTHLDADHVWIVEGEFGVHAAEAEGLAATCSLGGSDSADKADWSPVYGKHVTIVRDKDEAGAKYVRKVTEALDGHCPTIQVVESMTGEAGSKHDLEDHLAAGHAIDDLVPVEDDDNGLLDGLISAADLDAKTFDDLVEHVPGIVTEGLGLIVGPPKAGKSWWVANVALACSAGRDALGEIGVAKRPVLYLALEDGHKRLQRRLRAINGDDPLPAALDILTRVQPGQAVPTITTWLRRHRTSQPLVILDTFGKTRKQRKPGEDAYLADYQAGTELKDLIDHVPGACLLAVHHTNKGASGDFVERVSGTNGIAGAADFILVLDRPRKSDEATLAVTGRDVVEREIAMTTRNGMWSIDGDNLDEAQAEGERRQDRKRLGDLSLDVLAYVNDKGESTPSEVAKHFDIDSKHAAVILGRLVDSGRLTKPKRGLYRAVVTVELLKADPSTYNTPNTHNTTPLGNHCSVCGFSMSFPADVEAGHHVGCADA